MLLGEFFAEGGVFADEGLGLEVGVVELDLALHDIKIVLVLDFLLFDSMVTVFDELDLGVELILPLFLADLVVFLGFFQ